ncbi:hypothetical protein N9V68_00830 [Octadecabacter sp.]|nr:hypothetical protein [Octadecabacter sp.]
MRVAETTVVSKSAIAVEIIATVSKELVAISAVSVGVILVVSEPVVELLVVAAIIVVADNRTKSQAADHARNDVTVTCVGCCRGRHCQNWQCQSEEFCNHIQFHVHVPFVGV